MKVYLIKDSDGVGYYVDNLMHIETLWDGAEEQETYTISNVEMTEEEYDALPEFDGF